MDDYDSETIKRLFCENTVINLADFPHNWMLKHIDCFVSQSRGNECIEGLDFNLSLNDGENDEFWDKVGQAIGNLQALKTVRISTHCDTGDYDAFAEPPSPDWEILERILSHIRQKVELELHNDDDEFWWNVEESRSFARVIHGHPTITCFTDISAGGMFPYEAWDVLYTALATLPALESIELSNRGLTWHALADPESLGRLLRVPSLRFVSFSHFYFTHALWRATVNAFVEGTAVTKLEFYDCDFVDLQVDWSPIFSALGKNTGLKTLKIEMHGFMEESLCTAMQNGLAMNETLESLELNRLHLGDNNAHLWSRAFSFLRTNKALKSLVFGVTGVPDSSCLSAFQIDVTAMLQENTSLESIFFRSFQVVKPEQCVALLTSLQQNTTLKKLQYNDGKVQLTHDEDKHMAKILKKNYALESLPSIHPDNQPGDVGAILRLNEAGRRYLIEDGSSVSKGVRVLSAVSNDINCVFYHLLENPTLCDRSAVEMLNDSAEDASMANHNGKREQDEALEESKESRRRRE
jgi:hypothetical protein